MVWQADGGKHQASAPLLPDGRRTAVERIRPKQADWRKIRDHARRPRATPRTEADSPENGYSFLESIRRDGGRE